MIPKYKVWDARGKKWMGDDVLLGPDGKVWYKFTDCWKPISETVQGDYIAVLFTGLKDKNGEKIYEGDVVKVTNRIIKEDWEYIGDVRFNSGGFYVHDPVYHPGLDNAGHIYEVIGNIYDNPKLIEVV